MSFLLVKDLQVGYHKRVVVDNINVDLKKGEVLCLLGPNGCGKSTILKTITNQIKLLDGKMTVMDEDLNKINNREQAKYMSVVLTERIAPEMMTAEEVVAMGRYPHTNYFGKLSPNDLRMINEALESVNGEKLKDKEFKFLSDGEKQRILIARAICQESDIMVLDEPTSFLDIKYKVELLNIIKALSLKQSKTIIMSLHEIELASKIADKVLLIKDGKIYDYGAPEDIITDDAIKEVYNLNSGYFNTTIGYIELPKIDEEPTVFVIGGGGKATKIYRALNRRGIGFDSGILFKNDIDYSISKTLAHKTIAEDEFIDIRNEKVEKAKKAIKNCQVVIDSGVSLEGIGKANYGLIQFALEEGKKVVSLRKEDIGLDLIRYNSISSLMDELK